MATIRPFRALRPSAERAAEVAAVPYDVVNTEEARDLAAGNPFSFLHVSRPEIDMPPGTDAYSEAVYERARANFEDLTREAPLIVDPEPGLYIYRLRMGEHTQTGVAACCSVDEYDQDVIRKHERTRKDKEDDRTRHILSLRAQTGPVFLTYRGMRAIDEIASSEQAQPALYDFTAPDGVSHAIWRVSDSSADALVEAFRSVPAIYIADGHHRAKSASRAREELRSRNQDHSGEEPYNRFLAVLFPADQLQILAYNRVVKDLNGMSHEAFLKALAERFAVSESDSPSPERKGDIRMYLNGGWYRLGVQDAASDADPIASLDVSVLESRVLDPLLGIKDVRTDKRIDFVGGIRGAAALERAVDGGEAAVAFSMHPVTVDDLMAVSDAGAIMPPKSTWFEPKLRDGLLSHVI